MSSRAGSDYTKRMKDLVKKLRAAGFTVRKTRANHWLVQGPEGSCLISSTPSRATSERNDVARLKRIGFKP